MINLMDVGARSGLHHRWTPFLHHIRALAFEPDPVECQRLNAQKTGGIKFLPTALGEKDGQHATLYVTRQPGCSSILRPNPAVVNAYPYGENLEVTHTIPVVLERMDTVCERENFRPDVIKLDTQGTELDILRGAGKALDAVIAVESEVEFCQMYESQPLFGDMDQWLRGRGFELRGLRRVFWRRNGLHGSARGGQLMHADALWIRHELLGPDASLFILSAYGQDDLLAPLLKGRPELQYLIRRPGRFIPKLLRRIGSHRTWREWINKYRHAEATDWHDADLY